MASSANVPAAPAAQAAPAQPPAPAPTAVPALSSAELAAKNDSRLLSDIKAMVLYELRAKGYSPNPADVTVIVARIKELVADSGGTSAAYAADMDARIKAFNDAEAAKQVAAQAEAKKAADDAEAAAKLAVKSGPPVAKVELEHGAPIPVVPKVAPKV